MKLRKIVKHLDCFCDVELFMQTDNEDVKELWQGSILNLQVAANTRQVKERYIKECEDKERKNTIVSIEAAEKYLDYHLDTDDNGEAIGVSFKRNAYDVNIPFLSICIKKKK